MEKLSDTIDCRDSNEIEKKKKNEIILRTIDRNINLCLLFE